MVEYYIYKCDECGQIFRVNKKKAKHNFKRGALMAKEDHQKCGFLEFVGIKNMRK